MNKSSIAKEGSCGNLNPIKKQVFLAKKITELKGQEPTGGGLR